MVRFPRLPVSLFSRRSRAKKNVDVRRNKDQQLEYENDATYSDLIFNGVPIKPISNTGLYLRHRLNRYCGYSQTINDPIPYWNPIRPTNYFRRSTTSDKKPRKQVFEGSCGEEEGGKSILELLRFYLLQLYLYWIQIPVGFLLSFLVFSLWPNTGSVSKDSQTNVSPAKKRRGPWQLQVYTSLPLKSISRLFGYFNELTLPVCLRRPWLLLYARIFGCKLEEMADPVLENYPNLSAFFYRQLKPGLRPISDSLVVSPADGRVLHCGVVEGCQIEQIKGVTYDLNDLLGRVAGSPTMSQTAPPPSYTQQLVDEADFANVNGISYSLQGMFTGEAGSQLHPNLDPTVKSAPPAEVKGWENIPPGHRLFFCVIYLAPGDYHRFHSPTNWVVSSRRHFAGELYSVSPFIAKYLENLFVLNERVALEGRWRHGFFSMIPVGATNVGSINIHFDKDLKTNKRKVTHRGTYTQVSYDKASPLLGGYPLLSGQEMGGFRLGSTIVLVFSAPANFQFNVNVNQKVKMGQSLGDIPTMS